MKKHLKIYQDSACGDYVVTVAIGQKYMQRWEELSLPWWRMYCGEHGLGLAAVTEPFSDPGNKRFDWQKLLVGKALSESGTGAQGVCFVDYDVIPNPFAPNIFSHRSVDRVGFVSERNNLPYGSAETVLRRVAFHRHRASEGEYPLDSYLTADTETVFKDHGLPPLADYGCGGLFVFNHTRHAAFFEEVFGQYSNESRLAANPGEEVYLNYHIQTQTDVEWLDYRWHTLWWFEMASYYPWLYDSENRTAFNVEQAILSSLHRSHFLHFVGSWEKWSWPFIKNLHQSRFLTQLEHLQQYNSAVLVSPKLGLIFPGKPDEMELLSK